MTWLDTLDQTKVANAADVLRATEAGQEYIARYANGDVRFALWLRNVDVRLGRMVGLSHSDLGDWCIRDAYDDGMTPREAALETLANDDTYAALVGG